MPKEITIKNFKGIHLEEGRWNNAFASYSAGMDIWGLAKNPSKISFPGVLQGIFQVSAGAQAASPSAINEVVEDFEILRTSGSDSQYAAGPNATAARIYARTGSNVWQLLKTSSLSSEASPTPAIALKAYGSNLYYAQKNYLGRYTGSTSSSQFQTLLDSTISPRKMFILNGTLYGLNNRYVWSYDGTTFTNNRLTLPSNFQTISVEVYGDLAYITTEDGIHAYLIVWDGVSPSYKTSFPIPEEQNAPTLKVAGGILWIVANRGATTTGTPIYTFDGSNLAKILILPIQRTKTVGVWEYAGGLAIGSNDGSTATYEDGIAGIWVINRHSAEDIYTATLLFFLRNQLTNKTLGAIRFFGQNGYIAAQDVTNSSFEIFELQGSQANSPNIWQTLPIDAGATSEKIWHYIKINFENLVTSQTVIVKYRLDDATSFTTLKTFSTTGAVAANKQNIPLGRSSRTITIRVELTASASETTRLHSITLGFTPTTK